MDKKRAGHPFLIRRAFIKELGHELRSPLSSILGITDLCGELATDQAICRYLESIKSASHRLIGRIDELMLLLKLNAGPMDEENTGFCLEDVLEETIASGISRSGGRASDFSLDIGSDVPSFFVGAGKAFRLACGRIFDFCCDMVAGNPARLDVFFEDIPALERPGCGFLTVRVSFDTGALAGGDDEPEEIFPRFSFVRFSIPGLSGPVDCGLRLAIACAAVEGANGHMEVFNKADGGFVVSFSLPCEVNAHTEHVLGLIGSRKPVACVVEECGFRRILNCRRLYRSGCETVTLGDKDTLCEILEQHPPDFLMMSWDSFIALGKPDGNGGHGSPDKFTFPYEGRGIPIIITSVPPVEALSMQSLPGCGHRAGKICCLASPLRTESLLQAAHSALYGSGRSDDMEQGVAHESGLEGLCVLLVDDDEINQAVGLAFLEKKKIRAVVASSGQSVLRVAGKRRFDLILMDIRLPDFDGFSLTRQLRAGGPNARTPIVAMTASTSDRKRCIESGMNDFLAKPVEPEMLYKVIRRWAGRDGSRSQKM